MQNERRKTRDCIESAAKREVDSIHRAMVLIAGIEMENSENPPRLWTALEDAYDALSDALGTDGDNSADVEEAKVIGRHFVVKSYGNAAADLHCSDCAWYHIYNEGLSELRKENERLRAALKPVLEVYISQDDNSVSMYDSRLDAGVAVNAVREAKRIYNGGSKREILEAFRG